MDMVLENKGKILMTHFPGKKGLQYYLKTKSRDQFLVFIEIPPDISGILKKTSRKCVIINYLETKYKMCTLSRGFASIILWLPIF